MAGQRMTSGNRYRIDPRPILPARDNTEVSTMKKSDFSFPSF